MQLILSTLKRAVSILAFLCIFGVVGTMDYNDAVYMEQAQQSSKRVCTHAASAAMVPGKLTTDASVHYRPPYPGSHLEEVCGDLTQ